MIIVACPLISIAVSVEIVCSDLPLLINGVIVFSTDTTAPFDYLTTATYNCDIGYGLSGGDTVRNCVGSNQGGEKWNGTAPVCQGKLYKIDNFW